MKNNKNDSVTAKTITESKESLNGSGIPSDKTEKELTFKKALYGFNPDEVHSFINELTQSYEASLKLHESKLSAMKEELVFSNRERDRYIKKCKELQAEAEKKALPVEDKTDEYKAIISQLKEAVIKLKSENENLKKQQNTPRADNTEKNDEKISVLEARNKETEAALLSAENRIKELSQQIEKQESACAEYKSVVEELEKTKVNLSACTQNLKIKSDEAEEKDARINALISEKNETEKKNSELEIKNNVLSQRITECEEENTKLRETNKTIIFENAEKINTLENELAKSKLAVQKELKLYGYYMDRAELTVAELAKQIEQIKQSIGNSEI